MHHIPQQRVVLDVDAAAARDAARTITECRQEVAAQRRAALLAAAARLRAELRSAGTLGATLDVEL